jgi:glucan 1,3-beta-glucosidase
MLPPPCYRNFILFSRIQGRHKTHNQGEKIPSPSLFPLPSFLLATIMGPDNDNPSPYDLAATPATVPEVHPAPVPHEILTADGEVPAQTAPTAAVDKLLAPAASQPSLRPPSSDPLHATVTQDPPSAFEPEAAPPSVDVKKSQPEDTPVAAAAASLPVVPVDEESEASRAPTPFADVLDPPRPMFTTRDSIASGLGSGYGESVAPSLSGALMANVASDSTTKLETSGMQDKEAADASPDKPDARKRRLLYFGGAALLLVIVLGAVLGGVLGSRSKPSKAIASAGAGGPTPTGSSPSPTTTSTGIYGTDGTTVTADDGTTFIYNNSFGGYFVQDPNNPMNMGARANSWSPALNETWTWGKDKISGVNLGGWLVLEPFITPALYQKYPTAVDEWTLSTAMAADTAGGGLAQLEEHYKTFIVRLLDFNRPLKI